MAGHLAPLAGVLPMDRVGPYLHWGVIQISLANLIVIVLMLLVFVLALVAPFPRNRK